MRILLNIINSVYGSPYYLDQVKITGHDPILPSPFFIGEAGAAAIAASAYAASELWRLKTGHSQQIEISVNHAAIAQRSHEYLNVLDGTKEDLWSLLSGFYQTQDNRWIQFHCNFPHHRLGVVAVLGCEDNKASVTEAVKQWNAIEL